MSREARSATSNSAASPEEVWAVWTNPAKWSGGVIATAKIDGPFAVGARVTTRVRGYPPLTSTIVRIETPRMWTGVAKAPGLTQTIEHLVEPTDTGALLTERTVVYRPIGFDRRAHARRTTAEDVRGHDGTLRAAGRKKRVGLEGSPVRYPQQLLTVARTSKARFESVVAGRLRWIALMPR